MDAFWRPLYAAGVDVIVNGHDHDYERFAPQDPDGREDRATGIRQFVVGTGGTALRGFDTPVRQQRAPGVRRARRDRLHPPSELVRLGVHRGGRQRVPRPRDGELPLTDSPDPRGVSVPAASRRARSNDGVEAFASSRSKCSRRVGDEIDIERADALLEDAPHRLAEVGHDAHQRQPRQAIGPARAAVVGAPAGGRPRRASARG